jgi:hypothetical protein
MREILVHSRALRFVKLESSSHASNSIFIPCFKCVPWFLKVTNSGAWQSVWHKKSGAGSVVPKLVVVTECFGVRELAPDWAGANRVLGSKGLCTPVGL